MNKHKVEDFFLGKKSKLKKVHHVFWRVVSFFEHPGVLEGALSRLGEGKNFVYKAPSMVNEVLLALSFKWNKEIVLMCLNEAVIGIEWRIHFIFFS